MYASLLVVEQLAEWHGIVEMHPRPGRPIRGATKPRRPLQPAFTWDLAEVHVCVLPSHFPASISRLGIMQPYVEDSVDRSQVLWQNPYAYQVSRHHRMKLELTSATEPLRIRQIEFQSNLDTPEKA
jgi:hypothetical protein